MPQIPYKYIWWFLYADTSDFASASSQYKLQHFVIPVIKTSFSFHIIANNYKTNKNWGFSSYLRLISLGSVILYFLYLQNILIFHTHYFYCNYFCTLYFLHRYYIFLHSFFSNPILCMCIRHYFWILYFFFFFDWVRNLRMLRCYTKNPPNLTEPRSPNVKITARYEGGIIGESIFLLHPNVEFEAALRQILLPKLDEIRQLCAEPIRQKSRPP